MYNPNFDYEAADESVLKPIGELTQIITNSSAGEMLLFLIALDKKEKGYGYKPSEDSLEYHESFA